MTADKPVRIDEELVCIESFAHFLKERDYRDILIQRESDDPPDFWISIAGERYAAEVTSIVVDYGYHDLCSKLKEAILKNCEALGCLNGKYALVVMGHPKIPKRTSGQWRTIVEHATSYIRDTKNNQRAEKKYLLKDTNGNLAIEKLSKRGAVVGLAGPLKLKWEGEFRLQLSDIFQNRVDKKRSALERKGVRLECPNILLLFYDADGFSDMQTAKEVFQHVKRFDYFHSVYWAASFAARQNELYPGSPGRKGCFLYSKISEWKI